MSGRGGTGAATVASGQDIREPGGRTCPASDLDGAADDIADQVVQEAVGGDEERDPIPTTEHMERTDDAGRRVLAAGRGTERAEVVAPVQRRQAPAHGRDVEGDG